MIGFLVFSGVALSSIYLLPSGNPQLADIILLGFSALIFLGLADKKTIDLPVFFKIYLVLSIWILFISIVWSLLYQSFDFLKHPLFYIYNFIITLAVFSYLKHSDKGLYVFRLAVVFSVIISGIGVVINVGLGGRVTGFFNNPNQLAYFSLLGASLVTLLYRFTVPIFSWATLALSAALIGIFAAASLGAMAGMLLVVMGYLLANASSVRRFSKLFLIVPFVLMGFLAFDLVSDGVISNNFSTRMDRMESKVDDLYQERGYDRIMAFPEYWFFGAGEGHTERFYPYSGGEIHSTFGNIFFAYGAVGFLLFMAMLSYVFLKTPLYVSLVLLGPLTYSITHMGARTTFFWLLLMIAWYLYAYKQPKSKSKLVRKLQGI